jgi:hypothetical protein
MWRAQRLVLMSYAHRVAPGPVGLIRPSAEPTPRGPAVVAPTEA